MKKGFGSYIVIWLALVVLFNIICFVTPAEVFGGTFWTGYIFIMLTFAAHMVYFFAALSENNREERVLNLPLNVISWLGLFVMVITGSACMLIPDMPNWLGVLLCCVVLALSVILLAAAKTVGENADAGNKALNAKTALMRGLTDRAAGLEAMAKTGAAKENARRVYEALRYSDPVSSGATAELDAEISAKLTELTAIFAGADDTAVSVAIKELLVLIEKRASACTTAKREK